MPAKHGEAHHAAKLTDAQVIEIRRLHHTICECCGMKISGAVLGRRFGVTGAAIHYVVYGVNRVKG